MKKMRDTSKRREAIASMLREAGSVQVANLCKRFGVSAVTIRKDLGFLENMGISTRTYGGAMLNLGSTSVVEYPIEDKQQLHAEEKRAIGRLAAKFVTPGDAIILDSGTTTYEVAGHLVDREGVTVVTNGLNVMNKLSHHEHLKLIMLGGKLRRKNMSFFGSSAERALDELHVDKLFLGVDGFHMEKGVTTHFEAEAGLNRLMCKAASTIILVTDSSKFGKVCLHQILKPALVSMVITDSGIPAEYREGLESLGIEVLIAS